MSNIKLLHYLIRLKINEFDSNVHNGYSPAQMDILANEAIQEFVKASYKLFEKTQEILSLAGLVVRTILTPTNLQSPLSPTTIHGNEYEFSFRNLAFPFLYYVGATVDLKKDKCGTKQGNLQIVQHDDLRYVLSNDNLSPSWIDGEVVGVFSREDYALTNTTANQIKTSLRIFTDKENSFSVEKLNLTYLKKPNEVCIGGYDDVNGVPQTTVECDIDPFYYDEIANVASVIVRNNYGHTTNAK